MTRGTMRAIGTDAGDDRASSGVLQSRRVPPRHRAARVDGARRFSLVTVPTPQPQEGEVLLRVLGCGVCGSDLAVWQGRAGGMPPLAPGAPGHEVWGEVMACDASVADVQPGDMVAALCHNGFAEYALVRADETVKVDREMVEQVKHLPLEPLACIANAFQRAGIEAGDTVAVVGVGFIGAGLVALAAAKGADVTAISRRATALDLAGAAGARHQERLPARVDERSLEQLRGLGGDDGFDCVMEATGRQAPLDLASSLVRTRGRLVIAGFHQDGPRQVDMMSWNWRGLDVINAHERAPQAYLDGMRKAIRAIEEGVFPLDRMITHSYPLDRISAAFEDVESRPDGFVKAVVTP